MSKYNVGLKTLFLQGLSDPEFYGDLDNCSLEKLGNSIDVLRQTACLVVNPINVNNFAYLFDFSMVGRASG